ncbi:MAG: S1 family peptidase [Actinophytocola sp.]|uniref:S1 family peptidase n=1 Tax=Actinophytocola sp. TaxID=1872138 RepID=UPI003D6AC7A4
MYRRLAVGLMSVVLGGAAVLTAAPAQAAQPVQVQNVTLASTIALSNCSASLVRFPNSADADRAMMLTNGHCYEGGMPGAGQVLVNRPSSRSGTLLDASGNSLGTLRADLALYATMTGTDVTLYRLTSTYDAIRSSTGATALTIAAGHPADGSAIGIPSGYWEQVWNCQVNGFVHTMREAQWTWQDSIRYDSACDTIPGTSGSPVVDVASNQIVGINNTGNENGGTCTLNNPCEVDENGNVTVHPGQSYGQQTYWFTTCLDANNALDLSTPGCLLAKPAAAVAALN